MESVSRYQIFCRIIENAGFTKTAEELHYSQSAVSQSVKALERELGVTLVTRAKDGVRLTADGEQFFPFIQQIAAAEDALGRKQKEMQGLSRQTVTAGCFSSVGRHILPPAIQAFRQIYPTVHFELKQGDYSDIRRWVLEDQVDFGFIDADAAEGLNSQVLYQEKLLAILPKDHRLAAKQIVSMQDLSKEPFILLDEGEQNSVRKHFEAQNVVLQEEYSVYDDYSIMAMVRQKLGVSALFENVLKGYETGLALRPFAEAPKRSIALVWKDMKVMPLAARRFAESLLKDRTAL